MRELNSQEIEAISGGFDGFLIGCIGGIVDLNQDYTLLTATIIGGVWGGYYGLTHFSTLGIIGIPIGAIVEFGMAFVGYKVGYKSRNYITS